MAAKCQLEVLQSMCHFIKLMAWNGDHVVSLIPDFSAVSILWNEVPNLSKVLALGNVQPYYEHPQEPLTARK